MSVLLSPLDSDPGVQRGVLVQDLRHHRGCRAVVGDAQLPVWIQLSPDGVDRFAEVLLGRVETGRITDISGGSANPSSRGRMACRASSSIVSKAATQRRVRWSSENIGSRSTDPSQDSHLSAEEVGVHLARPISRRKPATYRIDGLAFRSRGDRLPQRSLQSFGDGRAQPLLGHLRGRASSSPSIRARSSSIVAHDTARSATEPLLIQGVDVRPRHRQECGSPLGGIALIRRRSRQEECSPTRSMVQPQVQGEIEDALRKCTAFSWSGQGEPRSD